MNKRQKLNEYLSVPQVITADAQIAGTALPAFYTLDGQRRYPSQVVQEKDEALRQLIFVCESVIMLSDLSKRAKEEIEAYVSYAKRAEAL